MAGHTCQALPVAAEVLAPAPASSIGGSGFDAFSGFDGFDGFDGFRETCFCG
jgi:hypothetical protein